MNFKLQITTKNSETTGSNFLEIADENLAIKEIQKNKLTNLMIEKKFVFECKTTDVFNSFFDKLTENEITSFKLLSNVDEVIFEKTDIKDTEYSVFSRNTEEIKSVEIVFFEYKN